MNLNSERQQECDENLDNGHQNFSKSEMIELKNKNGEDLNEEDLKFDILPENGRNERVNTNIEKRQTD